LNNQTSSRPQQGGQSVIHKLSAWWQVLFRRPAALIFRLLKALISPVLELIIRIIKKVSPKVQLLINRTAALILRWLKVRVVPILEPVVRVLRVIVDPLLKPIIKVIRKISAWWHSLPRLRALLILDWLVVIAAVILMVVIYVPKRIWAEEGTYRTESHRRMQIIQDAEEFYNTVRGNYITDGDFLFKLISQTHDSLIADTTFAGLQIVHVDGSPYRVNIPEFLSYQMDTTFSVGRQLRRDVLDTTYTVTLWNDERAAYDTLYINGSSGLAQVKQDTAFSEVLDTSYGSHSEVYSDYKWNRFRLEPELLVCPITRKPFIISLDSTESELTIASPITGEYVESRYILFKFEAKDHGKIVDGYPSWRN